MPQHKEKCVYQIQATDSRGCLYRLAYYKTKAEAQRMLPRVINDTYWTTGYCAGTKFVKTKIVRFDPYSF